MQEHYAIVLIQSLAVRRMKWWKYLMDRQGGKAKVGFTSSNVMMVV